MGVIDRLIDWRWELRRAAKVAWLWLRHRPLVTCPFCKGRGGAMEGYYEPEWSECRACWTLWNDLEDYGATWFVGRISLRGWVRAKVSIRFGFWELTRVRDVVRCRFLRWHRWTNADTTDPGLRLCCVCYEHKYERA